MKALKLIGVGIAILYAGTIQAQVSVNVNVGTPPHWGPVGYPDARYYYLPDVEAYYDIQTSMFLYNHGGTWVKRRHLPPQYSGYDLYGGYKVVMGNYQGKHPHAYHKYYKFQYAKGYRGKPQKTYGHRPDKGSYNAKYNPNSHPKQNVNNSRSNNGGKGHDNKQVKNNGLTRHNVINSGGHNNKSGQVKKGTQPKQNNNNNIGNNGGQGNKGGKGKK